MADQKTVRPLVLAYMVNLYPPYIVGGAETVSYTHLTLPTSDLV